jgi:hypothetical protein
LLGSYDDAVLKLACIENSDDEILSDSVKSSKRGHSGSSGESEDSDIDSLPKAPKIKAKGKTHPKPRLQKTKGKINQLSQFNTTPSSTSAATTSSEILGKSSN